MVGIPPRKMVILGIVCGIGCATLKIFLNLSPCLRKPGICGIPRAPLKPVFGVKNRSRNHDVAVTRSSSWGSWGSWSSWGEPHPLDMAHLAHPTHLSSFVQNLFPHIPSINITLHHYGRGDQWVLTIIFPYEGDVSQIFTWPFLRGPLWSSG